MVETRRFQAVCQLDSTFAYTSPAEGTLRGDERDGDGGVRGGDLAGDLEPRQARAHHQHALGGGNLRACEEGDTSKTKES
jgi:hypothetical protein